MDQHKNFVETRPAYQDLGERRNAQQFFEDKREGGPRVLQLDVPIYFFY